jgi:hypothetical protein
LGPNIALSIPLLNTGKYYKWIGKTSNERNRPSKWKKMYFWEYTDYIGMQMSEERQLRRLRYSTANQVSRSSCSADGYVCPLSALHLTEWRVWVRSSSGMLTGKGNRRKCRQTPCHRKSPRIKPGVWKKK